MFFHKWDADIRQTLYIAFFVICGIVGITDVAYYEIWIIDKDSAGDTLRKAIRGMAETGGALFLLGLITEGMAELMVMAMRKIQRAREEGREEGREEERATIVRSMKTQGIPEETIRAIIDNIADKKKGDR